jgi:hypothetical protein
MNSNRIQHAESEQLTKAVTKISPNEDMTRIYIRRATSSDKKHIVAILTTAFWLEDAVGVYIHTKKEKYPEDVKKFWRRNLRCDWPTCDIEVAVLFNGENAGKVVGVAIWELKGGPKLTRCKSFPAAWSNPVRCGLWMKIKLFVLVLYIEISG